MFTSLLQRQLKRYIQPEMITLEWQEFLEAVNRSYEHYERDHQLGKQSLEISTIEMRELAHEISDREARLMGILEAASDGILIYNDENKVVICNRSFLKFFGMNEKEEEFIGKDISLFNTEPVHISEILWNEDHLHELQIHRSDGTILPIELSRSEISLRDRKYIICVVRDITIRLQHQLALHREIALQRQLVKAAREAGMMQVATNVLHNVGNLLNSINIGLKKVEEGLALSEMRNLEKMSIMIKENKDRLLHFLTHDSKGKYLLDYIIALNDYWQKESKSSSAEIGDITKKIEMIKSIINIQQTASRSSSMKELILAEQMMKDLLLVFQKDIQFYKIQLDKDFDPKAKIFTDRSKLIQILENILRNAIDALKTQERDRKLSIKIDIEDGNVRFIIQDNGPGIEPGNILKIFNFGFTTKPEGHGFGLHSSSLLANELGGLLHAESEGLGKGATFILTVPISSST